MNKNRREILGGIAGAGALAAITLYGRHEALQDASEEAVKNREYERLVTEVPVPEVTDTVEQFAGEMSILLPEYGISLEHIRMGRYDETHGFEIDRYHVVLNAGTSVDATNKARDELDAIYAYVVQTNGENEVSDRVGTTEQVRRLKQDPEWTLDRPLTIPDRSPSLVGVAIRGNLDPRFERESLFLMVGGESHLEAHDATPQRNLGIRISYNEDSYRAPFVFDASVPMGPTPVFPS